MFVFDTERATKQTFLRTFFHSNTRSLLQNTAVHRDSLIENKVRGKVEQRAVGEGVGPPAQGEHHHPHPGQLDHCHLIVHMQVTETWEQNMFLKHLRKYSCKTLLKNLH